MIERNPHPSEQAPEPDPYALPPTAPPWRALEERVVALEMALAAADWRLVEVQAAKHRQRKVNEALFLYGAESPELGDALREALK